MARIRSWPGPTVLLGLLGCADGTDGGPFLVDTEAYIPVVGVEDLTQRTMNKAIETEPDSPGFRAAVHG